MATIKLVLRPNKERSNGTTPVYLRITANRKSRYLSTDIAVQAQDWNASREEVRRSHPQHAVYNNELQRLKTEAHQTVLDLRADQHKALSAEAVKRKLTGQDGSDFFAYATAYIERLDNKGKYWSWKKARVLVSKLRDFAGDSDLYFEKIDRRFLSRFEKYMRDELGNGTNTVHKNLQILHRIIKLAIRDGKVKYADNPFLHYTVEREKTSKDKLSDEQIDALKKLDLRSEPDLQLTRDTFLFSFYCAGIRFGDLCQLIWRNVEGGRLEYEMDKTGQRKSIHIPSPATEILDRYGPKTDSDSYVFPLLNDSENYTELKLRKKIASCNTIVNRNLKELAKRASIPVKLTFHVSRHSFADYARRQGMDLYSISKALGHSSLQVTEIYLKSFDADTVDEAMQELFD